MKREKTKKLKNSKGITLIALIITIIILLLLAGITISSLTGSGLFEKAQQAEQKSEDAQILENTRLEEYENAIDQYVSGNGGGNDGPTADPTLPENPATTLAEAQSDYMLDKEVNSEIQDAYGNKIVVPAGFKITTDATTVDKGIVVEDSDGNQFVWIPVPKSGYVYGENKVAINDVKIELNRYTFATDGTATPQGTAEIENYFQELQESTLGNTTAKSISDFQDSVGENEGYYIGRYEARDGVTTSARTSSTSDTNKLVCTSSNYVYNNVTQTQAATLSKNMYTSTEFTSDLMNSYAWDTAILFLQECGTNSTYSRKTSVNTSLATTGTNNATTQDVQCNVYDMASNTFEWTTETSSYSRSPCVRRGGSYGYNSYYTSSRLFNTTSTSGGDGSFRPLLYL